MKLSLVKVLQESKTKCLRYAKNEEELCEFLNGHLTCTGTCRERYFKMQETLQKHSITPGKFVGMGCCGMVFEMPDNKVFKITHDTQEACLSYLIKNESLFHVAKVYDVFKLGDYYGIIQERLQRLDEDRDKVFISVLENREIIRILNSFIKEEVTYEQVMDLASRAAHNIGSYYSLKDRKDCHEAVSQLVRTIEAVRPFAIPDLSPFNTMKNEAGDYYLIDMKIGEGYFIDELLDKIENY